MSTDFHPIRDADELLHPVEVGSHPGLTETSYFHFNIPAQGLTGELYVWFHSRLRMISAGVWIWKGFKRERLAAEYFDYRAFMPYHDGQIDDYTTPTGIRVKVIKPLEQIQVEYEDGRRGVRLHMLQRAAAPPVARARAFDFEGGYAAVIQGGFEQPMRVEGELELAGRRHRIDGYSIRDRSWNQVRDEMPRAVPPYTWLAAIADGNFSFCLGAYDDPALEPEWKNVLPDPPDGGKVHGWIHRDGETRRLVRVSKITRRKNMVPVSHELKMQDTSGREYEFRGYVRSGLPIVPWPNMTCWCGLTEWECDGITAWGDTQECQWADYVANFNTDAG